MRMIKKWAAVRRFAVVVVSNSKHDKVRRLDKVRS